MNIINKIYFMYRIILICISLIASSISMELVFAAGCDLKLELPTQEDLVAKTTKCLDARNGKWWTPNSITDYVCPQGNMFQKNNQSITNETLRYLVSVSISFNKIDTDILKYMHDLQKLRIANPTEWVETIRLCTNKIEEKYSKICEFGTIESRLNEKKDEKYILTTNVYPQSLCDDLAKRKIQWWYYLQSIIASDSINKNQKNSTDVWVTEVKWAYARVLWSWHTYQKILARAVSKMTAYIKESN